MKVSCATIEEFLQCLDAEASVFSNTVRFSKFREAMDGTNRGAVKFKVIVQSSAVIVVNDSSEYLLEAGEYCGMDYEDASKEFTGSERADELRRMVVDFADRNGLKVLPGVISE
jgi:hypothetical protein